MAFFDRKLPRVALRGELLYVEGEKEPYFRDPEHQVWMNVGEITVHGGFREPYRDEKTTAFQTGALSIEGRAAFEFGDRFGVIGYETDPKTSIRFGFHGRSEAESRLHWQANIGLMIYEPEDGIEQYYYVSFFLPEREFSVSSCYRPRGQPRQHPCRNDHHNVD